MFPRWVPFLVVFFAGAGVAHAQSGTAADPGKGYAEVVAQSAFGNVTSQNYGVEVGFTISPAFQVFGEIGHTRDVASDAIGAAAQTIAGVLPQSQSPGYSVKQPLTFGVGGLKYLFPTGSEHLLPYAMLGFGVAKVENDATFSLGGVDVTGTLSQYGIVLGSDLSGSFTKPMFTLGVGASYVGWHSVVFDFQFRYGHVFASGESINVSRAGLGLGFRF
ncbi:MAG TPA: outer membrane beta-barrel protein [Vicinamibacterales bacterium]|jgi:opacity protein-like surface antigen